VRRSRLLSRLVLLSALSLSVFPGSSGAALIAYDGFAYAPGVDLNGQNGGTGWDDAWFAGNPLAFIATPGLAFGGLGTTPGAATATAKPSPPGGGDITFEQRHLADSVGADGTTLYLSVLMRPEAGFGFYGGLNLGSFFIGQSGPTTTYGLEAGADIASSSVEAAVGETVLLVLRAQFLAGNDVFDLFVNPVPGAAVPLAADATVTGFDLVGTDTVTINNAGAWTIDEIRFGATFADVTPLAVPAPPVALLLAGGLIAGVLVRTRGRRPQR